MIVAHVTRFWARVPFSFLQFFLFIVDSFNSKFKQKVEKGKKQTKKAFNARVRFTSFLSVSGELPLLKTY